MERALAAAEVHRNDLQRSDVATRATNIDDFWSAPPPCTSANAAEFVRFNV